MANRVKGEVAFEVDGKDYVLLLDFNALCDLEDDFPGLMDGSAEMKSPKAIRRVFQAGLAARHPDLSEHDAGNLIHALGFEAAGDLIRRSFEAAFPKGGEEAARPRTDQPKAGAGTGR
jgi:hypothetical protein